jgi:hypothetical protein
VIRGSRARGTVLNHARADLRAILLEEQNPLVADLVDEFSEKAKGLPADEMLDELLVAVGAPNRGPGLLWRWWTRADIDSDALAHLILTVWALTDCPERDLGQRRWLELFRATGYLPDDAPPSSNPLSIYRGAPERYRRRMSWTTDPEIARRFATSETRRRGEVWRATVPAHAILARLYDDGGRPEAEVIINPNCLRGRATPRRVLETVR